MPTSLHLVNWNVNGIRSIIKKDFVKDVRAMNPDVLCLQETKASSEEVKNALQLLPEFTIYVNSSKARKGYSGTAILSKTPPVNVTYDMGIEAHDQEGRVIVAEFENFFLITVYVPNSGEGLKRLDYREQWESDFLKYVNTLNKIKPVIISGDLNVAHQELDIARAKENYNKSSGYTQREIDCFEAVLNEGFIDTFRHLNPTEKKYSYWNNFFNARSRNVGWRIDYFLVSKEIIKNVQSSEIYNDYMGSDHCPVALHIKI